MINLPYSTKGRKKVAQNQSRWLHLCNPLPLHNCVWLTFPTWLAGKFTITRDSILPGFQSCACGRNTVGQTNQRAMRNHLIYVKHDRREYTDNSANHLPSIFGMGVKSDEIRCNEVWQTLPQPRRHTAEECLWAYRCLHHDVFPILSLTVSPFHSSPQTSHLTGLFCKSGILHGNPHIFLRASLHTSPFTHREKTEIYNHINPKFSQSQVLSDCDWRAQTSQLFERDGERRLPIDNPCRHQAHSYWSAGSRLTLAKQTF